MDKHEQDGIDSSINSPLSPSSPPNSPLFFYDNVSDISANPKQPDNSYCGYIAGLKYLEYLNLSKKNLLKILFKLLMRSAD